MTSLTLIPLLLLVPGESPKLGAETRALAYLVREVPKWSAENRCYSCHNNGDGARALYLARRLGQTVPDKALADTTKWLGKPAGWDHNGGEGPFSDKKLARLQFAATLAAAQQAGLVREREPLLQAADLVAGLQDREGCSSPQAEGVGSPTTHGAALATALARSTLTQIDARKYQEQIARADAWFRQKKVQTVLDAAGVLLGLGQADDSEPARKQRAACLELIRKGENREGGWGPYVTSMSEVFDTSVVLLALRLQPETEEVGAAFAMAGSTWSSLRKRTAAGAKRCARRRASVTRRRSRPPPGRSRPCCGHGRRGRGNPCLRNCVPV